MCHSAFWLAVLAIYVQTIIFTVTIYAYLWPNLKNPTILAQQVNAPYHRYTYALSKHSDRITRDGQVCFSLQLFLGCAKHWESSTDGMGSLGDFNRMALIQNISQTLPLSCVVVCDWCGNLFGKWLKLGVPLGVFFTCWIPVATTSLMSAAPNITAMPVKASSRANYQRWLNLSTWSCKHASSPMLLLLELTMWIFQIDISQNNKVHQIQPHTCATWPISEMSATD